MDWPKRLLGRRGRQGRWLYIICLILYVLYALGYAGEASFHSGTSVSSLWYLLIPVVVIVTQLVYPTALGWAFVLVAFSFYFVMGTYLMLQNFSWSQWRVDTFGFVMGVIMLAILLGVCTGLYFFRPYKELSSREGDT